VVPEPASGAGQRSGGSVNAEQGIPSVDLGRLGYALAYERQTQELERVLAARDARGAGPARGVILIVEHDPVITVSRRPTAAGNVLASAERLAAEGVEVVETDRGGDVTYHGPGQVVAYPIVDLNALGLRLHDYLRQLEQAVIETCAHFGVTTHRDASATGVWTGASPSPSAAKIAAMGVRVRRWATLHGLALNVTTNLRHFELINPCGLGRPVTSLARELGDKAPSVDEVKPVLVRHLRRALVKAEG
jgi:lipoyl(octanoyl) transferase